jgi:tripartite-type tricarboxylate transporter receptor subunit TctC
MKHCSRIVGLLALAFVGVATAQDYPNRPIRMVVGFVPGGTVDIVARLFAPKMAQSMNVGVVVDNRPGAGANIAVEQVAKAPPDGYTVFMANPALAISASVYRKLNYDAERDLAPIGLTATSCHLLIIHPSLPVRSIRELIALAKARPGQLNFSSGGTGNSDHLPGEMLKGMAGIDMVHVPYKGGAPAAADVVSGQVSMYFAGIGVGLPLAKAGRVRGLAVTSRTRASIAPEYPTMDEAGVRGFETALWTALFAPAGTPRPIIQKLNAEIMKALETADLKERLAQIGAEPFGSSPEKAATYLHAEIEKYAKVARAINLKID